MVTSIVINFITMRFDDVRPQTPAVSCGPVTVRTFVMYIVVRMSLRDVSLQPSLLAKLLVAGRTCLDRVISFSHIASLVVSDIIKGGRKRRLRTIIRFLLLDSQSFYFLWVIRSFLGLI